MCYDPYAPRCFESIKQNLLRGKPILVRVHCAADYPVFGEDKYKIDIEGQALLILGYDDLKKAFAVIDPYAKDKKARPQVTWMSYDDLAYQQVDCSRGNYLLATGLDIFLNLNGNDLEVQVGFCDIAGNIMDHDSCYLEQIFANIVLDLDGSQNAFCLRNNNKFLVGERATFHVSFDGSHVNNLHLHVVAEATLAGTRPYDYKDKIRSTLKRSYQLSQDMSHAKIVCA